MASELIVVDLRFEAVVYPHAGKFRMQYPYTPFSRELLQIDIVLYQDRQGLRERGTLITIRRAAVNSFGVFGAEPIPGLMETM